MDFDLTGDLLLPVKLMSARDIGEYIYVNVLLSGLVQTSSILCAESGFWPKLPPEGGGGELGSIFSGYVLLASPYPYPIIVYSVANYRPHVSHLWANKLYPKSLLAGIYLPLKSRKCATHSSNSIHSY